MPARRPIVRVIRGLAALVALIIGTVGVPTFLVILIGNPLPAQLNWSQWVAALSRPDDGAILVGLLAVVAWAAWAVFTVSVIIELLAALSRQRVQIRLPGLAVPQRLASGLVVAAISLVGIAPQVSHAVPPNVVLQSAPELVERPQLDMREQQRLELTPSENRVSSGASDSAAETTSYTVQRGDDLWTLAERFYGEGREWRRIAAANPEVLTGGPDRLEPGWRLRIPDVAKERPRTHVVERGDTLTSLAESSYGEPNRWPEIFDANRFQLDDPDELPIGLRLELPGTSTKMEGESLSDRRPTSPTPTDPEDGAGDDGGAGDHAGTGRDGEASRESASGATRHQTLPGEPDALPRPTGRSSAPTEQPSTPAAPPAIPAVPSASSGEVGSAQPDGAGAAEPTAVHPLVAGVAGVGGLLAAAVVSGTMLRRRRQLQLRPVGRRIAQPSPAAQLVETHLGTRQQPMGLRTLDLATRAIAARCHTTGDALPELETATVADDSLVLQMSEPALAGPDGFQIDGTLWRLAAADIDRLRSTPGLGEAVRPYPALVSLGATDDGAQVVADLEALRLTSFDSTDEDLVSSALAAVAVELSCSPWAEELELILLGVCPDLPPALGHHNVTYADELEPVLNRLTQRAATQRRQWLGRSLAAHRVDADLADPWVPVIMVINRSLSPAEQRKLRQLVLAEPPASIVAVGAGLDTAPCRVVLSEPGGQAVARVEPYDVVVRPQLLTATAADAVVDLVAATGRTDTTPAPWWFDQESPADPDPPDNVTYLGRRGGGWSAASNHSDDEREGAVMERQTDISPTTSVSHPVLQLLGPVELEGAAGTPPTRAAKQCLEYCAWLLEHPGTSAQQMATALAVAEGTRRSNMSRLRSWLGSDEIDQPYLPDAYSGRIMLHPSVSSDWQRLQILTGRGVNRTSVSALEASLQLVRGAPLADAAPGQWHWAESLRTDMISAIRDIGVELANRALADSDVDLARWAATRALAAAPGDELLLVARIKTEHRVGHHAEVERLTLQLAAHARSLEVDLRPDTVDVMQEMMEGRVRARLA